MIPYKDIIAAPGYGSVVQDEPEKWCWKQTPSSLFCRRDVEDPELGLCPKCVSDLRGDNVVTRLLRKAVA